MSPLRHQPELLFGLPKETQNRSRHRTDDDMPHDLPWPPHARLAAGRLEAGPRRHECSQPCPCTTMGGASTMASLALPALGRWRRGAPNKRRRAPSPLRPVPSSRPPGLPSGPGQGRGAGILALSQTPEMTVFSGDKRWRFLKGGRCKNRRPRQPYFSRWRSNSHQTAKRRVSTTGKGGYHSNAGNTMLPHQQNI